MHVQTSYYEANFLDPGTYSATVDAPGFKGLVRSGIAVATRDRLSVDLRLEIGAENQSIEVNADAPLLETTNASGGRVLDNREISQLPYSTMNPFALQAIVTGAPAIARVFDNAGTASLQQSNPTL